MADIFRMPASEEVRARWGGFAFTPVRAISFSAPAMILSIHSTTSSVNAARNSANMFSRILC